MDTKLEQILTNMKDAGCEDSALEQAANLYRAGNAEALILHLRRCRCGLMDELHQAQRKVDCLDYLIRKI